jgi:hypothetical protein
LPSGRMYTIHGFVRDGGVGLNLLCIHRRYRGVLDAHLESYLGEPRASNDHDRLAANW